MKGERVIPHHPVLVVSHLEDIGAGSPSAENQVWGIKGNEESETPSVVDSEVFPIVEMILRDDVLACRYHFVWCSELFDDFREAGCAIHDEMHILC